MRSGRDTFSDTCRVARVQEYEMRTMEAVENMLYLLPQTLNFIHISHV